MNDATALSLVGVAMRLAGIVHDYDPAEGADLISRLTAEERGGLPYVLAALIPVDRTAQELLAWRDVRLPPRIRPLTAAAPASQLTPDRGGRRPAEAECGTRNGYLQHIDEDSPACAECETANRAWERTRLALRREYRAAKRAEAEAVPKLAAVPDCGDDDGDEAEDAA